MSSSTSSSPPNWYPDPSGRHQLRYFDGAQWTDHVSSNGNQSLDPLNPGTVPIATQSAEKHQKQLDRAGVVVGAVQGGDRQAMEPEELGQLAIACASLAIGGSRIGAPGSTRHGR